VEGDFSWTHLNESASAPNLFADDGKPVGSGGINWSHNLDRLGSVRGRFGYAVVPNVLLFGTGGIAWEHSDLAGLNAGPIASRSTAFDQTHDGFVVGGGVDWAPWNNNWIFRLEYLHYQFTGTSSTVFFPNTNNPNAPIANTFNWDRLSVDSVRAGVSYKF
jgi:outer membrane immunogenic protein